MFGDRVHGLGQRIDLPHQGFDLTAGRGLDIHVQPARLVQKARVLALASKASRKAAARDRIAVRDAA
jgi:hypothetical protein